MVSDTVHNHEVGDFNAKCTQYELYFENSGAHFTSLTWAAGLTDGVMLPFDTDWGRDTETMTASANERTNANPSNRAQKLEERRKQEQEQDKSKSAGGNVEGYSTQSKRRVRRLCVGKRSTGCWSQERAKLRAFPRHLARENTQLSQKNSETAKRQN